MKAEVACRFRNFIGAGGHNNALPIQRKNCINIRLCTAKHTKRVQKPGHPPEVLRCCLSGHCHTPCNIATGSTVVVDLLSPITHKTKCLRLSAVILIYELCAWGYGSIICTSANENDKHLPYRLSIRT